jgi:hypothetical protein
MKRYLALAFCAALVYTNTSLAGNINYNYFEVGYVETEWDFTGIDVDGDGYEFNASVELSETLAVVVGYQELEFDAGVDANLKQLGFAYHKPYSTTGDMVVGYSYLEIELEPRRGSSVDDSGNEFSLEIRSKSSPETEVSFALRRVEVGDDAESGFSFGIVSGAPQGFQFVLDYTDLDNVGSIMLGLRSAF